MTDQALELDELGPVDDLVVEFLPRAQTFTGEAAEELLRLAESGLIRILDLLILVKDADGNVAEAVGRRNCESSRSCPVIRPSVRSGGTSTCPRTRSRRMPCRSTGS